MVWAACSTSDAGRSERAVEQPANMGASTPSSEEVSIDVAAALAIDRRCGACHRSDSPDAKPAALFYFDLLDEDWYDELDAEQLQGSKERMRTKGTPAELEIFTRWADALIARRSREQTWVDR